ncbi:MAG: Sulfate transporter [Candidatus Falkowbacteria bacterium GW2011_GWC2_38_22]|uniref:Sulfate transporter n=1 Tax=Candidatus Falkowbacteria bacterium GW2011_GWE1_38_31 TaxID=1618638 RepID=A0A0G0JS13_9BACT|nr:MAG: Sulfate transporter [Candidatus Falkowbacteria bacterium GW2011_GWF2_38_1205]KKQ61533.1 MAG: Sulfate transporter [Candidatus Falkowbacteria bacterium GW2011_GWC2_38_22]KKQ63574.1 MAG: Sulfate transporter [Candidatus Falkowbacteria bacterium GW2011_GWF1_38_22]KKQ65726.1 MAG: Sulfate transporter [Candidatus Falkowbacteria bacterium GW2011_GWE2_38_254]KKQ70343.1 MAG: Sulfate transporter [Candidatus Falkowbacteria bacterium GW2011_GWE1_38_31]KKQ72848.1 MAG: Sulfate transporter [Candidatus 
MIAAFLVWEHFASMFNSKNFGQLIRFNWKSGLTVALVSIPLSIALAIASGATPTQGVITALWAGLIGAIFGGSHFNIIGPTGALSGILIVFALANGSIYLPLLAIISGLMILFAYYFHLDRYIIFIPRSVVHGFTLGVAMIIGLGQLDNIFGLADVHKTDNNIENIITIFSRISEFQWGTFLIFLIGTVFIFAWNKKFPKLPGAIVLTAIGIGAAWSQHSGLLPLPNVLTLADKYHDLSGQVFLNVWSSFSWTILYSKQLWVIAAATAMISILETLLSGQIAENMTKVKFNRQKEVFGLGLANVFSGLAGGIPATAALARTSLNIKSKATHKTSAVISSFFIMLIILLLINFFQFLPLVVVASILVYVAISMLEKEHFIYLIENEKTAFWLSVLVAVITVAEDPIIGIMVGSILALLIFVQNVSKGQTEVLLWKDGKMFESLLKDDFIKKSDIHSDLVVYKISGALTYINMPAHIEAIEKIKSGNIVIISLRHAYYIDTDGVKYLEELIGILKQNGCQVYLSGVNPVIKQRLQNESFYCKKFEENKIYMRTYFAVKELYLEKLGKNPA